MIKKFSAPYWIGLTSICCIGSAIALACSDGWGEEYGVSNFAPEIFVDSAYSPFFYSFQFYYGIGHEENQDKRFNSSNTTEWTAYLKNAFTEEQVRLLLETAGNGTVDSLINYRSGKIIVLPAFLEAFGAFKEKTNKNLTAFLAYLQLAKKCESFALNNAGSSWDFEEKATTKKTFDATGINRDLLSAFTRAADNFLKERYWFQLSRSYFFNGNPQQVIDFFTAHQNNMPRNSMYFRTMAYAAGAWYKLKNYSRANYLYSRVYDSCDQLKTAAHYSFHPQEESDWRTTLSMCTNNAEKITLWQMLGVFYADEQRAINEIYKLNPASDKLDLLLARIVNKYEQRFNSNGSGYNYMDTQIDSASMITVPSLVFRLATSAHTGKPWVWQMAAGYLQTLDGNYAAAADWLKKAEKSSPPTQQAGAQIRLLKMINTIARARRINSQLESQILADITWLKNFDPVAMPQLRYTDAFDWLKRQMAIRYKQQGELVKAECFISEANFYSDDRHVEALKSLLTKKTKTPYEKLCADLSAKKTADLYEFQAICLAYADSVDATIEKMAQAAGSAVVLPGNPFNGRIQDCHDCDHAAPQKIQYSKIDFVKKLKEIKEKINKNQDLYTNALLLGNAYYNMSHFGNARSFYECKVIGEGHSDPTYIDSVFQKMLTAMNVAVKYYSLALDNSKTDEQKAKCEYMLAKCQRNQWYNANIYSKKGRNSYDESGMPDLTAIDGFRALSQYAHTQYYKDVLRECGYFRTYSTRRAVR